MSWTAIVHYASVENGTTAYDEVNVTTVAALSGYGSYNLDVIAIDETPEVEASIMYASGKVLPSNDVRYSYPIQCYPKLFSTERDDVTTDLVTLAKKKFLWLELNTAAQDGTYNVGTTTNYHATDKCIPVTLDSISIEHSHEYGNKKATINFIRRFRA